MSNELTAETFPLSPMQQGMLFHSLSSAHQAGVDVEQIFCTLHEDLNVASFHSAWRRAVARHSVLRTSFHWQESTGPQQQIHTEAEFEFTEQDWRKASEDERKKLFSDWLETDRNNGVDVTKAPLMRLAIFRHHDREWQFLWTFHHLLLDGRAVVSLLKEVFVFYESFDRGEDLELPPPHSYREFIDWVGNRDKCKSESFWRQNLKGCNTPTQLLVARSESAKAQGIPIRGEQQIHLSEATTSALKSVAKQNALTLNTLVLGAWAVLLSRYSGEEDVIFGVVRACRHSSIAGAESLVGLCINTVPLRIHVTENCQVMPWLAELRSQWVTLREFEHTPLVDIQGWSEVPRDQPLFESILNFQDPSWDAALRAQGGKWRARQFGLCSQSNYPLVVDAYGGAEVLVKILYHRARFDDSAITRMLAHFKTLLEGIAAHSEATLSELPMLTEGELHQLLVRWNDTRADFPKGKCVHQLVEEQAERSPDALAVCDESTRLSYGELNSRATLLAAELRNFGVRPDVCVGVCLERSAQLVVALLAVWKAGGAYVPIDPAYPKERLKFMLEDAKMPVLITRQTINATLKLENANLGLVFVDVPNHATRPTHHEERASPRIANPAPTDLAYVIYTSGSTGLPKGVEIEHARLLNLIAWHQRTYTVTPADRASQVANPAFDACVWELWPYLTAGASIHIPDEQTRLSPEKLPAWMAANKITLAFVPTPLAQAMLDVPWPENSALRALLTGGDKLHNLTCQNLPFVLVNHYGPTENTVVTTAAIVSPDNDQTKPPPIGRPIANLQVYILDRHARPVPIGVAGELYIGGAGLARGYHCRSELTAEKFVPNPFNRNPGARLYKTGDLVRWLSDGQIEFLGRLDDQVKIRGQRLELGEVEDALLQHDGVRESAVVASANARGESRLVAYVAAVPGSSVTRRVLREFLKQKLPAAMLPSAFVFVDSLPLTANGKVDRKGLPPADFSAESQDPFTAPRTPTEKAFAEIWLEVLGLRQVGVHDNFFEIGGHSLNATQAMLRAGKTFGVELPLQELFTTPTIAELAARFDSLRLATPWAGPTPTFFEGGGEVPLSFAQERLWFMEHLEPGQAFNNIPFAIRLEGTLNTPALERAIAEIIRRHKSVRTAFDKVGGRPVGVVVCEAAVSISTVDLRQMTASEREASANRRMFEEARRPFHLAEGPLLRVKLIRLADEEHLLLLTMHHIICDGWSMGIFNRELSALYQALSNGKPSPLPELPFEYTAFASWQRERLQGGALEEQLNFWKKQLRGAATVLDLPTDRPRPPTQTYRGATHRFALPPNLTAQLRQLSRKEDVTLFMLLLSAFQALLHHYTGQEDILIGSPIAGRTRVETENLIGLFLNSLVLRGDLTGNPTFRELLRRNRRVTLDAYAHQELPFERLVDALQPERDLSRAPFFQVMLVLQNEPLHPLELAGLKLTVLPTQSGTAKFDLTLSLEEIAGGLSGFIEYNTDLFEAETMERLLGNYQSLLEGVAANVELRLSELPLLTEIERQKILIGWNETSTDFAQDKCVHQIFEEQVERTPEAVAVVFEDEALTYRELHDRANQLGIELQKLGVGTETRVGVCMKRSLDMIAGLLAILKAGGCYVPLDPTYPKERLAFMLEDAQVPVLLTQVKLQSELRLENPGLKVLCVDAPRPNLPSANHGTPLQTLVKSENLAYVMYTSGSTGRPKGVMVTHRNVVNFFVGIDKVLGTQPGVWLAVTSISFDISVLELFWTLARGFKVIIQSDDDRIQTPTPGRETAGKNMDFSLLYFANEAGNVHTDKYRLLIEGAKFADEHGFAAVWTPERHFHAFGALFPNASVTSAAVAMVTKRIQIRAGSVVLPLHHPLRIAEEWSVVDNLSNGRVAISFASGWHDRDFAFAPDNYEKRKEIMFDGIETVRKLWRGEPVICRTGVGAEAEIRTFPRPVQKELPVWITAAGNPETFRKAGELGANLLTHLLGQSLEELATKIRIYRAARMEHCDGEGKVALMLHTFVGKDLDSVRETVRNPFCDYLKSSRDLLKSLGSDGSGDGMDLKNVPERDLDALAQRAFDRYFARCGFLGTPESCRPLIDQLKSIGVDEVACLLDFGVDHDLVIDSLPELDRLRKMSNTPAASNGHSRSVPEQILFHGVTHMQCTPSLAKTLILAPEALPAMRQIDKFLVGGEALPVALAKRLRESMPGEIINMYGPTETTVWSTHHRLHEIPDAIPIGRPIANTEIYLVDKHLRPVPIGVAGEILIGGEGVARGYLNRPELTEEKFIHHPFRANAKARLYRTGDLGRFRADGTIEFLGRLDHQVKIRGHRIELGEIELAIGRHPAVREVVVVAREDTTNEKRLVAYVVAASSTKPTASELRRFTQDKLPEAMTPSVFVFLDALPLTPNGKANRQALPAPENHRPELETAYVAPRTGLEKTIAEVWRELLGVQEVGLHDNFFDLGGNSLLIVQAQARLGEALGRKLAVVKLFQYPTIHALAGFLDHSQPESLARTHDRGRLKQVIFSQHQKNRPKVMA
jgi:natural product biosynthesis luciferase-like monooxygenase protein/amino acid adenylation domain-containing protein